MAGGGDNPDTPVEREKGFVTVNELRYDAITTFRDFCNMHTNRYTELA